MTIGSTHVIREPDAFVLDGLARSLRGS